MALAKTDSEHLKTKQYTNLQSRRINQESNSVQLALAHTLFSGAGRVVLRARVQQTLL